MSGRRYSTTTDSNHVEVSFTVKEDGHGTPFIFLEGPPLMPKTFFSFDLKAGTSLEEAHEIAAVLRKAIHGFSFSTVEQVEATTGSN